jgi:hypothetical protein
MLYALQMMLLFVGVPFAFWTTAIWLVMQAW